MTPPSLLLQCSMAGRGGAKDRSAKDKGRSSVSAARPFAPRLSGLQQAAAPVSWLISAPTARRLHSHTHLAKDGDLAGRSLKHG